MVDSLFLGRMENIRDNTMAFFEADAGDYHIMRDIIRETQPDIVYNLAVVPLGASLDNPLWCWRECLRPVETLCELLREDEYERLVHVSSSEAYGTGQTMPMTERHSLHPCTPYASAKAAGDLLVGSYIKTWGVSARIVRPFNTYGPRQNMGSYAGVVPIWINRLLRGESVVVQGDGLQRRDYTYVVDTARGIVFGDMLNPGTVMNVCSGESISMLELLYALEDVMGVDAMVDWQPTRRGDVREHRGCGELAKVLCGWQPETTLKDGLKHTVDYYKQRYGVV